MFFFIPINTYLIKSNKPYAYINMKEKMIGRKYGHKSQLERNVFIILFDENATGLRKKLNIYSLSENWG